MRVSADRLADGWDGAGGTVFRLARPGDVGRVAELAEIAGGPLEQPMSAGIEDGTASRGLLKALQAGTTDPLVEQVVQALTSDGMQPFVELSMVLVAERGGRVVGALYSIPPLNFITQVIEAGMDPPHALMTAVAAVKVKALAVDPDVQGVGIASELLRSAVSVFDQVGFHLAYGSFDIGSGLESFYGSRGFDVLPLGAAVQMEVIVGRKAMLAPGPGEQMFARWR